MRDLLVLLLVLGALPHVFSRAWIGVLVWSWLGYMNPHRLTFGFAYSFPFSQLVGLVTLIAFAFDKDKRALPATPLMFLWGAFIVWLNLSTLTAIYPDQAAWEWDRTMKIMLFCLLTVALINTKQKLIVLVWVVVASLGFFGVKGGVFSVLGGGHSLVWGPPQSFITDNNSLGMVLVMTMPLMFFLSTLVERKIFRLAIFGCMGLTALAILGTHSRGALLASVAMLTMLWWKSPYKGRTALVLIALMPVFFQFMPDEWWERMQTIRTYQEDGSAMGRLNAWGFAIRFAMDHPLTGGGFSVFSPELFMRYAPDPLDFHDAHSIYFEVLAEQGFVGLGLFLTLGVLTLLTAGRIIRLSKPHEELAWARSLAAMVQVSLTGYAVGGAFLGMAYFDLYYHLIAIVMIAERLVQEHLGLVKVKSPSKDKERRKRRPRSQAPVGGPLDAPAPTAGATMVATSSSRTSS
ncbi:MAG: putative O-glycosylation ligase, exosortase A system-associated [Pseudomonadota bacterium]